MNNPLAARDRARSLSPTLRLTLWLGLGSLLFTPAVRAQVTPVGSELQVNTYTTAEQDRPDVLWSANGEILVVWESEGSSGGDSAGTSVQMRRLAANGTPIGAEMQVNSYVTGNQSGSRVSGDMGGAFVVVFTGDGDGDDSYTGIHGRRFNSSGSALGSVFLVNSYTTGAQTAPAVARSPAGPFVVVWASPGYSPGDDSSDDSVQMRRFNDSGAPQGTDLQVNTYTTDKQFLADVDTDGDGDFVVVWQSNGSNDSDDVQGSVRTQRFASDGSPQGASFQINQFTTGSQGQASVASTSDGDFVVAWSSNGSTGNDNSLTSMQVRRFTSNGAAVGNEMQVNQYTTGFQSLVDVAQRDDGTFVVVWQSSSHDGADTSGWSLHGRLYSSAGAALTDQFSLNSYTNGNQQRPRVEFSPDGGEFVVAWDSVGSADTDDDGASVQLRRFAVDSDGDGVGDGDDACPGFDDAIDGDFDTVPDGCDVCPGGDDTLDADSDGVPDACDICDGDDATGDGDSDGLCFDSDCDDGDPTNSCEIFDDGFESADTDLWSAVNP